jgi:hypothetical protein
MHSGFHIAAAAAAQRRRRAYYEEEERMTHYSSDDLKDNWEFKIVRADMPVFAKPEVFQQLMQEESISGWEMVEKLDDRRVRFKRPASARKKDMMLPPGIDPYRTHFGRPVRRSIVLLTLGLVLFVVLASVLIPLLSLSNNNVDSLSTPIFLGIIFGGVLLILLVVIVITLRFRR